LAASFVGDARASRSGISEAPRLWPCVPTQVAEGCPFWGATLNKATFALVRFGLAAIFVLFIVIESLLAPANAQASAPSQDDNNRCISAADNFVRVGKLQLDARNAFASACAAMEAFATAKLNERLNYVPNTIAQGCAKETIATGGLYVDYVNCQDETLNKLDESQLRKMSYWQLVRDGQIERLYWTAMDCREAARPKFTRKDEPPLATGVCLSK